VIAVERDERLHTLGQLVRLAELERNCRERGDHSDARAHGRRMREVVRVLGFDPIRYEPGRDMAERLIRARTLKMLRAMPGTTRDVSKAAGVPGNAVRQYMLAMLLAGEVRCTRRPGGMWWEVVA
jgi:hypothetical protein